MIRKILKLLKYRKLLNPLKAEQTSTYREKPFAEEKCTVYKKIESNIENLRDIFKKNSDVIFREFRLGGSSQIKSFICFIEGMVDKKYINEYIMKSLMYNPDITNQANKLFQNNVLNMVKENILTVCEIKEVQSFNRVIGAILSGDIALFFDNYNTALVISGKGWAKRSIEEPQTEAVIRGPREGFTETLGDNISLLRRKIKNANLIFEVINLGTQTHTDVCITYIDGIVNKDILEEIKNRLNRIDNDAILESGYIEEFIKDNPFSTFPTIGNSQKPDTVAAKLLEGKIAIICEGTPVVLTIPYLFVESFIINEDYYSNFIFSSFSRLLRLLSFVLAVLVPAIYVALQTFHQEMIPSILLLTMAGAREGVPFPSVIEVLGMLLVFEILRESGIRMPRPIGQTVSIVGALVIGQAAVEAGFISAPVVIIVSIVGISSFINPPLLDSTIFLRFIFLLLGSTFGLYGIVVGIMCTAAYIFSLRSFGVPYSSPFVPVIWQDLKDSFIRFPLWFMRSRPRSLGTPNLKRQKSRLKPNKPSNRSGGGDR